MNKYRKMSKDLVDQLALKYEPVGITLYHDENSLPKNMVFYPKELKSYCRALILAGQGETLLLRKEQMGCKLGTSVLGFEKKTDDYLDDGVLEKYGVGLFGTEEASADTILNAMSLENGKTVAACIAPLSAFEKTPQVVVFIGNSEQTMWLLYALNYNRGGKMELPQAGGAMGGCSDITVYPMVKGDPNITFLGLGCRIKSDIGKCDLMMGISGTDLHSIHSHMADLAKPISMLAAHKTFKG